MNKNANILNFKNKLLLAFITVSIIPFALLAFVSIKNMTNSLEDGVYHELEAIREIKKAQIERTLEQLISIMEHVKNDSNLLDILDVYSRNLKQGRVGTPRDEVVDDIEVTQVLAEEHDFHNVLLIDPQANIVFSLHDTPALGDNLLGGELKHSNFAKAFQAARQGEVIFVDFEWHKNTNELMSFICTPLYDKSGIFSGVAAFQLHFNEINEMMTQRDGMGESGESYLVGPDLLMRSDSFLDPINHSVTSSFAAKNKGSVNTESVQAALRGEVGHGIINNYLGNRVLSSYTPVIAGNLKWALLVEKEEKEAFAVLYQLRNQVLIMAAISIFAIIITVMWGANGLAKRVKWLQTIANNIALRRLEEEIEEDDIKDELSLISRSLKEINDSFRQVTKVAEAAAAGDFSERVKEINSEDTLAIALNRMIDSFAEIISQANSVAHGDYNVDVVLRSDRDQLGLALRHMTKELQVASENDSLQRWLHGGITLLDDSMRGEQNVEGLAGNVIVTLCEYLKCQVGAIYLLSPDEGTVYRLAAGYAYLPHSGRKNSFKPGEGLAGQAVLKKIPMIVSDLSPDYIKISSGLGDATPNNILVFPFIHEDRVSGVVELGAITPFDDNQAKFLELVGHSISIAFEAAFSQRSLSDALSESQSLTEELQLQHKEMEESNELLEEQAVALEQARQDSEEHNQQLEKAHVELQDRAEQLALASKYKSEFLANMSHELRTPLNSILLLSRVLADDDSKTITADQRKQATVIHDAGSELLQLINEVLDMSKIEAGQMRVELMDLNIEELVQQTENLFTPQTAPKGLYLKTQISQGLPTSVQTDPGRVQQVIRNFLSNAVKFTQQGGITLGINFASAAVADNVVQASNNIKEAVRRNPENYIAISVSDTGNGIQNDKHGHIFQAFQQLDGSSSREFGGIGLGLSISLQIANLLGGGIALHSKVDQGSIFTLLLPLKPQVLPERGECVCGADREINHLALPEQNPGLIVDDQTDLEDDEKRAILVIEDDIRFADILINMGREQGFKVLHAKSGTEGLRYAERYRPIAILLDIQLPVMDGWNVLHHLKKNGATRHIPVHIMSIEGDENFCRRLGAVQFLAKPVGKDELDSLFERIDNDFKKPDRKLLVVCDNENHRETIVNLLIDSDVEITAVGTGTEAIKEICTSVYNTMILDLHLPDMDGYQILKEIREGAAINCRMPIVIYTGHEITLEDERKLREYADSIVLKTAESPARLLEDISIFMHRAQATLSQDSQYLLEEISNIEKTFVGKTVLLVDDDIRNTYALSASLKKKGLTIITAANGEECLEQLAEYNSIDIVLMDIMMPVMDGFEAMRRIRAQDKYANLPVIAVTAKALSEDKEKCIKAGASDYMSKPIDYDQLFSLIRVWLSVKKRT